MGKQRFRKGLAGGLAALMLLQAMPMAASARSFWDIFSPQEEQEETAQVEVYESRETQVQLQDGTAVIPSGATESEVKDILFKALVDDSNGMTAQELAWEYYYEKDGLFDPDSSWVSIFGQDNGIFSKDYPALADNEDGNYRVRIADTDTAVTLTKVAKQESEITLKDNCTVALPYNDDGTVNYDELREAIWDEVVADTTPDLSWNSAGVSIEYRYNGEDFGNLEGDDGSILGLGSYDPISSGEQMIRISWDGNDSYYGCDETVEVNFTDRTAGSIVLKEDQEVALPYISADEVDYEALEKSIFDTVVESIDPPGLTVDDVTITYYYEGVTSLDSKWIPLEGQEVVGSLGYPPISASDEPQKIRISWDGNSSYSAFQEETTVTITERAQVDWDLNENVTVGLAYTADLNIDYEAMEKAIYDAVVNSNNYELDFDDVTIEYNASKAEDVIPVYKPLDYSATDLGALKKFGAGTWTIRFSWNGTQAYLAGSFEATVTVNDREQIQFNLNEGPYEVGMKFTADQGYDYEATAQAIYEAVVASTTPAVDFSNVTLEFSKTGVNFEPLDQTNFWTSFGVGEWKIRISVADTLTYRGNSVTVDVTTTDNRLESSVALKSGVSFTYNMDPSVMEQAIFDSVIDWENSTLPNKDTLSLDNFTIEYYGEVTYLGSGIDVGSSDWSPIGGKDVSLGSLELARIPQMGAGENQQIRVSFHGNADYRPSDSTEGTVTVNKATVKVSVHSDNIYADEALPEGFITTDPADDFDQYVIYAGITSNVTTALYLDLPDRYDDNAFLQILDPVVEAITGKSFTDMLNDGVTVGELRELLSTQELLDLLDKLNIDTGTFGQILEAVNKMPGILDSVRISFGAPNRAGLYTVAVVTDNQNYETGFGMGFLLVKMRLSGVNLTWNQEIQNGKLTAEEAKTFDFGATLSYDGVATDSQESVSYLYSGFTSKWRVYSSTTTPPTEPGRYVMTVVTLGGNYQAAPITRSFQITK